MTREAQWKKLDRFQATEFIQAVASPDEPALFATDLCEVCRLPLSFYDGYFLTRIINKYMMPFLTMDYLSNGEHHYYMDGSDQALQNLNAQGAISLSENNVIDYIDLYISYVYEYGNSLEFIRDPHDMTQKGSGAMEMHFNAIKYHHNSSVFFDTENEKYKIITPLIYQDRTLQSQIEVFKTGRINIIEPVSVTFLENLNPKELISYRHPHEKEIIEQSKDILSSVEAGQRLLKIAQDFDTPIRVLTSPNYRGFITNQGGIYILMPATEKSAKFMQALVLAYALRDVEQIAAGYTHPALHEDKDHYVSANYSKNLDMILEMCKIAEEFQNKNIPEALHVLQRMGLESVYSGYKTGLDNDALMKIYLDSLKRYRFLTE